MKKLYLTIIVLLSMFNLDMTAAEDDVKEPAPSGIELTDERKAELNNIDIPILNFSLKYGAFPDFDCVSAPEGAVSSSIANNIYVEGELSVTRKGDVQYESGPYKAKESGVRLKVRGNGSSNIGGHKAPFPSYKIKLSKKANLIIGDETVGKSKDWVLLKDRCADLNHVVGFETGRVMGLGWQPRGYPVALMINGNYFGSYFLIEAVSADKDRINITDTGFIIENDVYWWTQADECFKSEYIHPVMGWTFKDPDFEDWSEDARQNIEAATRTAEKVIYEGTDSEGRTLSDVIDIDSFAGWVLLHDVINSRDGLGSNMFVIKDDLDMENPFSSKFRMSVLWDTDGAFKLEPDDFCSVHGKNIFWFQKLFQYTEFRQAYKKKWNSIKATLYDDIMQAIQDRLPLMPGLDASRRFAGSSMTTEQCIRQMENYFQHRIPVLDELIQKMPDQSGIEDVEISIDVPSTIPSDGGVEWISTNNAKVYGLDGIRHSSFVKGINIIRLSDGKTIKIVY